MNILLIHGLGRTPLSLWTLGNILQKAGHHPTFFGYTSVLHSFDDIAQRLRLQLRSLSQLGPYGIVSHSLGGILTRAALTNANFPPPAHVVMLAPPNQSPLAARLANRLFPFRWYARQCGQNMAAPAFYQQLPILTSPYTLIAGTAGPTGPLSPFGHEPNDLILSISEVRMHPKDTPLLVPALHSFIMNHDMAQRFTLQAFAAADSDALTEIG
ncbi:MAG: alpha/beta hydrolase [Cyanobacteria bacterium J06614_10]